MKNSVTGSKVASSFLWVLIEKFGYSGISLLSTLVLARLLSPYEFGLVGSVAIITSISNMLVESGMGAALVNKENTTEKDYNTVFTFNLSMSCFLYALIFIAAPFIAGYLGNPVIKDIIRVLSLSLIINAFTLVQRTILIKNLLFKKQSFIALFSLSLSVIISVFMAYQGWGVWAIVAQLLLYAAIYSVTIFFIIRYIPKIHFSFSSFKELLGFGGRVTLSSAIQVGYNDIISSVIAKIYSIQTTGLYVQSQKLISFPVNIFRSLFDGAAFPILSKIKDKEEFAKMCSQINRGIYLLAFPLLLVIPFNTQEIIKIVLGNQWLEANTIFSILSVGVLILLIEIAAFNILKSSGNAKSYLRIGIYRAMIGFSMLLITFSFSLEVLLLGIILTNLLVSIITISKVNTTTAYKVKSQLKDIGYPLIIAVLANVIALFIVKFIETDQDIIKLLLHMVFMLIIFLGFCYMLKVKELNFVIQKMNRRKNG